MKVNLTCCISDCCDGSDEYEGKVKCKNDCHAKGEELRKQREAEKEKIQKVNCEYFTCAPPPPSPKDNCGGKSCEATKRKICLL